ncbi:hypothetical protein B0I35DRAFT_425389 [Stachybotrys elegans]|uniref:Polynucleotide 5'-hydroxyl-kinase GRC3 n=1 Tax=Stachybotrys elegans TaxID=80388 RepID=A0A8K0WW10_9HYPO|nr:hypothetical protein B0I35DRAFT_425389 [Stachybotrys elegans]
MSSSKRRKLESQNAPQSAVTALSALAARRRLATAAPDASSTTSPSPPETPIRSNPFSPLQSLKGKEHGALKSPQKKQLDAKASAGPASNERNSRSDTPRTPKAASSIPSGPVQYSSFRLSRHNHMAKAGGVVQLNLVDGERFMILGSFGIRVLEGETTVLGATLRPSDQTYWIHAPHCHAIPVIRTSERTILELHNDPDSRGLRQLGQLSPLYQRIWNDPVKGKRSTYKLLQTSDDAPKKCIIQNLTSPPEWNKKLSSLVASAGGSNAWVAIICGPKSSGKSTFSKLLTNRLLTNGRPSDGVILLDLDPGQPEFSPAGTVALIEVTQPNLGPPFTHPGLHDRRYRAVRCHSIASVSPASAPDLYLECAFDLIETFGRELAGRPLLVNTPGWILGTGLELLSEIITRVGPNEVIYMSEEGPADTVDVLRSVAPQAFTTLPSQQSEFTSRTAAHFRAMQAMSYFHLDVASRPDSTVRWNATPLTAIAPWGVRYSGPGSGILGILSYDYQAPPQLLAECINGMVLAAVEVGRPEALRGLLRPASAPASETRETWDEEIKSIIMRTPEGIPYIPNPNDVALDPRYSRCLGLVLVRAVDQKNKMLQVITPISHQQIQDVRRQGRHMVLVHGKFDAPTWAYTEDLYERTEQEDGTEKGIELVDEDTSEDDSDDQPELAQSTQEWTSTPWVEALRGNQKRPVGSKVWRVRRDLGRSQGE